MHARHSRAQMSILELGSMHIALFEPEIPPNTGNIARLCAAANTTLHIIGVTGFRLDDKSVKRAGLDYWDSVRVCRHIDLNGLYHALDGSRFLYFSTKAKRLYTDWEYKTDDCLVFGPETRGLPAAILEENSDRCLRIPILNPEVRSLNLANSVAIVLFEALRQLDLPTK